jgi:hypothetical protein
MFNPQTKKKREMILKIVAILIFLSMIGLALAGAF